MTPFGPITYGDGWATGILCYIDKFELMSFVESSS